MVPASLYHVFLLLALYATNITALPRPLQYDNARALVHQATAEGQRLLASIARRTAAPMDTPTGVHRGQSMYNGSSIDPTVPSLNVTDQGVNCVDLSTGRDNRCWNELSLSEYVKEWIVENTCHGGEGFSMCYLRQNGYPELDCTGIKLATCTPPSPVANGDPRAFYVAFNIYAVNQFFGSWYTSIGNAATLAGLNVDNIVQLIDPPSDTTLIMDDILIALTGIFAVAPGLGFNVGSMLDRAVEDATKIQQELRLSLVFVENAMIGFPQIGRFLYPVDTPASSILQMADLKNRLSDLIATVQTNLNMTVSSVMADPAEFLAFASQGNFTASAPSLPDETQYLLYAFNTYIISTCLRGNNVYGTIAKDTNVQSLATNGSQDSLAYDISSCVGYSAENVCDTWWYSGNHNSTFGLDDFSHIGRGYNEVLTQLFEQYTTGQLLFDNAYQCNLDGQYGESVSISVSPSGINTRCLSQLKILTWDMSCTDPRNKQCEFVEEGEGPQGSWLGNCGSQSYFSVMDDPIYCVPNSYLGPLINQRTYKLDRN